MAHMWHIVQVPGGYPLGKGENQYSLYLILHKNILDPHWRAKERGACGTPGRERHGIRSSPYPWVLWKMEQHLLESEAGRQGHRIRGPSPPFPREREITRLCEGMAGPGPRALAHNCDSCETSMGMEIEFMGPQCLLGSLLHKEESRMFGLSISRASAGPQLGATPLPSQFWQGVPSAVVVCTWAISKSGEGKPADPICQIYLMLLSLTFKAFHHLIPFPNLLITINQFTWVAPKCFAKYLPTHVFLLDFLWLHNLWCLSD